MKTWSDVELLYAITLGAMVIMFLMWVPVGRMFRRKIYRSGCKRTMHGVLGWGCAGIISAVAWWTVIIVSCLWLFVQMGGFQR